MYQLSAAQDPTKTTPPHKALRQLKSRIRSECPLLGKQVAITGTYESREDMHGRTGVATSFDFARGRYVVVLDARLDAHGGEEIDVRPDEANLRSSEDGTLLSTESDRRLDRNPMTL